MATTYDTIGALIDDGYRLTATCCTCWHNKKLDLHALADTLGRSHGSMRDDLTPKLRCSACQGKNIALTLCPPGQPSA